MCMKFFIREEVDSYRVFRLKKGARTMADIGSCLYRTDDRLFYKDPLTSDAYIQYRVGGTQPGGYGDREYLQTEETRVFILSGKIAGTKSGKILNLNPNKILQWLPIFIVGMALLFWALQQAGL